MTELHAVIMAGGSGTRFWPASRKARPKQLLPLAGGRSLLQATVDRLDGLVDPDRIWIVTNPGQVPGIREVMPEFREDRILVEPEARNTAPCIALATAAIESVSPGAVMAVMPADHLIEPVEQFTELLRRGVEIAGDGRSLVTFGIRPTHPATGYGYIEPESPLDEQLPAAWRVRCFREKPDLPTAEAFLARGDMLWNSGIFVWSSEAIRAAMRHSAPDLAEATDRMLKARTAGDEAALIDAFRAAPKTSIDYAVMEGASQVAVVEANLRWYDLGSFLTLDSVTPPDERGMVRHLVGGARSVELDSKDCVVYGEGARSVALLGVEGLVVVQLDDVVMVCPKDRAEDLRLLHEEVRRRGLDDLL